MTDQLGLLSVPVVATPEWARSLLPTQAARVAKGIHPLGGGRLKGGPETCAQCVHAVRRRYRDGAFYKCALVPATHGPATDLRLKWAACERFEGVTP